MPEKNKFKFFFLEDIFVADRLTWYFDRPATGNKLFPDVALMNFDHFLSSIVTKNISISFLKQIVRSKISICKKHLSYFKNVSIIQKSSEELIVCAKLGCQGN